MESFKNITSLGNLYYSKEDLKKEYKEALKNEEFSTFVSKLKVDEEILMKYTSLLEESACEYSHCLKCKNIFECKNKTRGYAYLPKKEGKILVFSSKPCKYKEKMLKENSFKKNITLFQVQDGILDANMKEIYLKDAARHETIEYITKFVTNYPNVQKGLFLHGSFGSGKSYLVTAAFCELAKKGYRSTIVFWPNFLKELKSKMIYEIEYDNMLNNVMNTPLLFIDDLGAENVTGWNRDDILCSILQYRMENKLTTFITSNFNISELEMHFSITKDGSEVMKAKRIIERIKQLTDDIELVSKNLRN